MCKINYNCDYMGFTPCMQDLFNIPNSTDEILPLNKLKKKTHMVISTDRKKTYHTI